MTGSDPDLAVLARCVGDVDAFASAHWGERPLHRASGAGFDDLLDLAVVEHLLLSTPRRPTFRLVRDGVTLPVPDSTTRVRMGGAPVDDVGDPGKITAAIASGATLVLQGLQRTWLPLTRFCRALERATSHPVQANAYLTPAGAAGLAEHADDHDVIVLQVTGGKAWEVAGLGPVTTAPGDALYIPAGARHAAHAQEAASLHLTLGILRVTVGQVVRRVLDDLEEPLGLGRPLPLGYARPERREELEEHLAKALFGVAQALEGPTEATDPGRRAEREARRALTRRAPLLEGQLASILEPVEAGTVLRRRLDQPARLAEEPADDGRIVLELADRRLRLPAETEAAIRHLLECTEAVVGDLPGLTLASQLVLVRRLVREQLLVAG